MTALARAEAEARDLGHGHIGTEHLLLGLLADAGSTTAAVLDELGAALAPTRHKVVEAVGASDGDRDAQAALAAHRAAACALSAAPGGSPTTGTPTEVGSAHVLLGVLDVEGTAGQVLRGLGVDVDRLRAAIDVPGLIPQLSRSCATAPCGDVHVVPGLAGRFADVRARASDQCLAGDLRRDRVLVRQLRRRPAACSAVDG